MYLLFFETVKFFTFGLLDSTVEEIWGKKVDKELEGCQT